MSYKSEFETIDLLQDDNCKAVTRGVDAFALALIKAERQIRKLFTYLAYQYPCFSGMHIDPMRDALAARRDTYFDGFLRGVDAISPVSVAALVGSDFSSLRQSLNDATELRNKIFHGQLTTKRLSGDDLFSHVDRIRLWCQRLASGASLEFGYDGFDRDSYQKAASRRFPDIHPRFKTRIGSLSEYQTFLRVVLAGKK